MTPELRRQAIERLLRSRAVTSQEALRELLAREGFAVTQATLSRDLARLGARRARGPRGEILYEPGDGNGAGRGAEDPLALVRPMVISVDDNGALVVIHTVPGSAPAVARAIDLNRPPEVLGTLAGDDTVFVAPRRAREADKLRRQLRARLLFERGGAPAGRERPPLSTRRKR